MSVRVRVKLTIRLDSATGQTTACAVVQLVGAELRCLCA